MRRLKKKNTTKLSIIAIIAGVVPIGIGVGVAMTSSSSMQSNFKTIVEHLHPKLTIYDQGKPTTLQANIGIDYSLWNNHSLYPYGMQGMAPLHTHDTSGTIHVEYTQYRDYTLGQFLDIWGRDLTGKQVKMTIDGQAESYYRNHILKDRENIVLNVE